MSTACGNGDSPSSETLLPGTIVAAVGRAPGDAEARLVAYDDSFPSGRRLASGVDQNTIPASPPGGSFLPYTVTTDGPPMLLVVDVKTGKVRELGVGDSPAASAERLAYCQPARTLNVLAFDSQSSVQHVAEVSPGCAEMVWRGEELGFLQLISRGATDSVRVRIWKDHIVEDFDVPVPVKGYGSVSWSAQGSAFMYSNLEDVVEISRESRSARVRTRGERPKYSPVADDIFAVVLEGAVQVETRAGASLANSRGSGLEAGRTVIDFAWSPDGTAIALLTTSTIDVWRWSDGGLVSVAAGTEGVFLPSILWFP